MAASPMTKILVIQLKMIGDVLVSSILCETLANAYPDAQIDYLVYEHTYPVIQENPKNYRVVLFSEKERKSKRALIAFAKCIRREHYDVVIDAYSKLESWAIVAMSGAVRKISFKKGVMNCLYTDVVPRHKTPRSNLGLAIEHRLKLLQPLGIPDALYVTHPNIHITKQENQRALAILQQHQLDGPEPLVVVNILGSTVAKTYPENYMAQVVDCLAGYNIKILFNHLPKQTETAEKIFNLCKPATQAKVFLNLLSMDMRGFLALMNHCACIIGNDGGAMNMAKALDKPTFIIFSPWIEKEVWATFEDGIKHVSVHLKDFYPQWFAGQSKQALLKNNQALYAKFHPGLMLDKMQDFCQRHFV